MKFIKLKTSCNHKLITGRFRRIYCAVAILVTISSCSSAPVHLYDGSEKTKQELALLWLNFFPHFVSIDGDSSNTLFDVSDQYYVLPGYKTISFELSKEGYCSPGTNYFDGKNTSYMPGICNQEFTKSSEIPMLLEAGHTYLVTSGNLNYSDFGSGHFAVEVRDLGGDFTIPPSGAKQYEEVRTKAKDTGKLLYGGAASRSYWNQKSGWHKNSQALRRIFPIRRNTTSLIAPYLAGIYRGVIEEVNSLNTFNNSQGSAIIMG